MWAQQPGAIVLQAKDSVGPFPQNAIAVHAARGFVQFSFCNAAIRRCTRRCLIATGIAETSILCDP